MLRSSLFHGCGGLFDRSGDRLNGRHRDWSDRLLAAGYVVFFPDSFGSRGLTSICTDAERSITPRDRVADVRGAFVWLASQPYIDFQRIALLGWSNGGSTVLRSMAPDARPPGNADFRTAIAFYPGCRLLLKEPWKARVPLSILIGDADDWTPPEPCKMLSQRWGNRFISYPGAYHSFDAPKTPIRIRKGVTYSANGSGEVHVGTNEQARAAAIATVMQTLEAAFRGRS